MAIPGDQVPAPGTILAGKYEVVRVIGEGGMGVVLEARHQTLSQSVAIKLLRHSLVTMPDVIARFEREGRAVARLRGPHVARVLDVDELPDGTPFMVMELLRGRELGAELSERGPMPVQEAVGYVLQTCAAMDEAHRMGIVHRDLKPANLFLHEQGGIRAVKVVDFGISKLTGDVAVSVTQTASAFGTPLYMSPEQVRSVKHVDARSDIWSLGVVLYEMLTGQTPFQHQSATALLAAIITDHPRPIAKVRPGLPSRLADAVMTALEKDPARRFADVREFAVAIAPFGPPLSSPGMAAVAELVSGTRGAHAGGSRVTRRGAIGIAAGVVAGVAAGVIAIAALRSRAAAPGSQTTVEQEPPRASASAPVRVEPAPAADATSDPASPSGSSSAAPDRSSSVPAAPKGRLPVGAGSTPKPEASQRRNPKYL